MKELSIEQKAEAYDEALRVLHKYDGAHIMFTQDLKEEMFPELKESDNKKDERIIKALIQLVNNYPSMDLFLKYDIHSYDIKEWLEKQGEQKPAIEMKSAEESLGIDSDTYNKIVDECIYGEQKPVDSTFEIKPKFKSGDIIKEKKTGNLFLVNSVEDFGYTLYYKNCNANGCTMSFKYEDDYELVEQKPKFRIGDTIKKESTGDIVTISEIDLKNREYRLSNTGFIPFKYEYLWELVEQKPAEEISSNPNYISPKDKALFEIATVLSQHEDKNGSPLEEIRSILVDYGINNLEANEQKHAWSEEDEDILNTIINHFKIDIECTDEDDVIRWLKSLRPQKQVVWTKEDSERFSSCLKRLGTGNPSQPETINSKWFREHVSPQKQWKPSDEQIEALESATENCAYSEYQDCLQELIGQLKKLREE